MKYDCVMYTVDSMGRLSKCEKIAFLGDNRDFEVILRLDGELDPDEALEYRF